MAKNNTIVLQVKVDDKQLKRLGLTSKKVAKDVGDVGTSAHSADRQLKGAAKASSNTTKNFSKMAQGINGGLVPAYATFAASVFALGAVFRALSSAADLRILVEGQKAFGEATGKAMRSVAQATMLATESQISFREASQAAAIAGAAGFNADQIVQLGQAATNVSKVLGRDVTDSFNRLVRGTTKAEPELLDELGIILRLEVATQKYAAANNKLAKELTIFEKQQAVLNEVLGQAERKYAAVAASIKPNEFQQLAVSIEKITDKIGAFVGTVLGPFATFLGDNLYAAGAAVGLFGLTILRSVVPSYDQWIERTKLQNQAEEEGLRLAQQRFALAKGAMAGGAGATPKAALLTELTGGKEVAGKGQIARFSRGEIGADQVSQKALANFKSQMAQRKGFWKDADDTILKSAEETFHKLEVAQLRNMNTGKRAAFTLKSSYEYAAAGIKMAWSTTLVGIQNMIGATVRVASKLMRLAGVIGMIMLVFQMLFEGAKGALNFFRTDDQKRFNEELKKTNDFYSDLGGELQGIGKRFNNIQGEMSDTLEVAIFLGNVMSSISFKALEDSLGMLAEGTVVNNINGIRNSFNNLLSGLEAIDPRFKAFFMTGTVTAKDLRNQLAVMKGYTEGLGKLGAAAELYGSHQEKLSRIRASNITADSPLMREASVLVDMNDSLRIAVAMTKIRLQGVEANSTAEAELLEKIEKENEKINENVVLIKELVELERQRQKLIIENLTLDSQLKVAAVFASKSLERSLKIDQLRNKINQDEVLIAQKRKQFGDNATKAQEAELAVMEGKLDLLRQEVALQENLNNKRNEFIRTFQSSFQSELSGAFYNAIVGNETSLKDAMLNMVNGIGDALAKRISDQMAEQALDALGDTFGIFKDPAAQQMEEIKSIQEKITQDMNTFLLGVDQQAEAGGKAFEAAQELISKLPDVFVQGGENIKKSIMEAFGMDTSKTGGFTTTQKNNMDPDIVDLVGTFNTTTDTPTTGTSVDSSIFNGPVGELLKSGIDKSSILTSIFGAGASTGNWIKGLFGMAKGGIMGYESGGVASDPTYIVGEGKKHEAVVPLPDNRSIPVKMNGNKGTNNVSVNVNMDGSTSTTATGDDAAAFGAAVSAAVQEEIQRQTRPGGILNRGKG